MSDITELAAKCLQDANGDVLAATESMQRRIKRNPTLYRALMDPLVRNACYDQVRLLQRGDRSVVWNNQQPPTHEMRRRITALADTYTLCDFPLPSGKKVSDASPQEIREAAGKYRAQGINELHKARWLELVADAMDAGERCNRSADRLEELKALAERDINCRLDNLPQAAAAE